MTFQTTVKKDQAFGVVGELFLDGPLRAQPLILESVDAAYNVIGRAFTLVDGSDTKAQAGGTGVFAGILANPKVYASYGTQAGGPLAPTLTLANEVVAEFVQMGQMIVALPAAANIGDLVTYNTTTGLLGSIAQNASYTGVIAVTTGVMTVTGLGAGEYLAPGASIKGTNVPGGTVVTSQLTGTAGKDGTYQTNIVTAVASTTMTSPNSPLAVAAGNALVPNCVVDRYNTEGAGVAVIKLTN